MFQPQIAEYERRQGITLVNRLGFGRDGAVITTSTRNAVKFFSDLSSYERERDAYVKFLMRNVTQILGHNIPILLNFDDELKALEMTIVHPPYLLDFASAYPVETAPDFPEGVMEEWLAGKRDEFGPRWPRVERVMDTLRTEFGLVLLDINPGNITFADEDSD